MKKNVLLVVLCFLSWNMHAQYQSLFGDSVTEWMLEEPDGFSGTSQLTYRSDTILISGADTFHRVEKFSYKAPHTNEISYIKEDLQTGKYWSYKEDFSVFRLFMDLSLQVGDSTNFIYTSAYSYVDSVYFDTHGRKHIRFNIPYGFYNLKPKYEMIEGVGTSKGLIQFHTGSMSIPVLICHQKDDNLNYQVDHPSVQNCNYSMLGLEENSLSFQVYPNPASSLVTLKTEQAIDLSKLRLYSAVGQEIEINWVSADSFSVEKLNKGLYFITYSRESSLSQIPLLVE